MVKKEMTELIAYLLYLLKSFWPMLLGTTVLTLLVKYVLAPLYDKAEEHTRNKQLHKK